MIKSIVVTKSYSKLQKISSQITVLPMPIIHLFGYVFIFRQGAAVRKLNILTVPRTMALFSFYLILGLAFDKILFYKRVGFE